MRTRPLLLALLAATGVSLAVASVSEAGADDWLVGRTAHFTIYSNGREKDVREVAQSFEKFRAVLRAAVAGADEAEPTVPLRILAFRHSKDFKELVPDAFAGRTAEPIGFFVALPLRVSIYVDLSAGAEAMPTLQHEYHHLYFDRSAPWASPWLREGLADLWGATTIDGRTVEIAKLAEWQVRTLRDKPMLPLDRLLAVTRHSPEYTEWDRTGTYYAESAVFTHFLLLGQPDGEKKLQRFGTLVAQGVPQLEALRAAWGDPDELWKSFLVYVRQTGFSMIRATLTADLADPSVEIHPMSAEAIAAMKGDVLADSSSPARAKPYLDAALGVNSNDTIALEAMGRIARAEREPAYAAGWFARAAAQPDAPFSSHYLYALTQTNDGAAIAELDRAVTLDSRFALALSTEATLLARRRQDPARARALAMRAVRVEPGAVGYLLMAAGVEKALGNASGGSQLATEAAMQVVSRSDADANNLVCWEGAIAGFASVVFATCERAVTLAPDDWNARDSRGVARALTGDRAGAIDDFTFTVAHASGPRAEKIREQRGAWIEALKAGKNPLDAATLAALPTFLAR